VSAIAHSPNFAHLRVLNLHGVVGDTGLKAIADSPHMSPLTTLWMNMTAGVTDSGMIALARSKHLRHLSYIDISGIRLTEKGQQVLLDADHIAWPGLIDHDLKTDELKRSYGERFDHWYGYDIEWDEPFFSWTT
jgi:hypothetical protein